MQSISARRFQILTQILNLPDEWTVYYNAAVWQYFKSEI